MSRPHEQRPASRPTLEDLLQLKRSERPAPEFWDAFNRGLREKQLAALVHQPRGWERIRPLFTRAIRWTVPVGATALAAIGLVRHLAVTPAGTLAETQSPTTIIAQPAASSATVAIAASSTGANLSTRDPLAEIPNVRMIPATVLPDAREGILVREINSAPVSVASAEAVERKSEPATPLAAVAHVAADALQQPMEFVQDRFIATADLGQQVIRSIAAAEPRHAAGWGELDPRLLEVSALDLRVSTEYAGNLMSTPVSYSPQPRQPVRLSEDERDYRDAVSRVGLQGSSLTIRF